MKTKEMFQKLAQHFGYEGIVAALPQYEVRKVLGLVSVDELADSIGMSYDELRWRLNNGSIPNPTHRLVRRCFYTQEEAHSIKESWERNK